MSGTPDDQDPRHPPKALPAIAGGSLFTGVGAVCEMVAGLAGVDGAAVAVFAPSQSRELVYATDAVAQQIDDLQFTLGEGPCLDAYRMGTPQLCPRLDTDVQLGRWPAFCDGAADLGVQAVFAFPVHGSHRSLGVLELYRRSTGDLESGQLESASVSAKTIGETLLQNWGSHLSGAIDAVAAIEAASVDSGALGDSSSRFSRAGVHIASGMVAVQLGVSADEGLDRLRAYAFAEGRSINLVAADIVARRLSLRGFRDDRKDGWRT